MSLSRSARTVLAAATVAAVALPLATTAARAQESGHAAAAPYAGLPSGTKQAKTLVIGIDGATFGAFSRADVPHIEQLMAKGLTARSDLYANPMAPTVSGAGWSSIATGAWPDKHNVKDNNFTAPDYGQYPDYATRLETADPATSTLVVGTWSPIPQIVFGPKTDLRIAGGNDEGTTAKAEDYLAHGNPDSTFVHLDEVDGAGHSSGSASDDYLKALNTADAQVGRLLDAVTSRPTYADEDWLVAVTADHGHTPTGGHGGNTPLERGTFVIAQGKGIEPGSVRDDVKITDTGERDNCTFRCNRRTPGPGAGQGRGRRAPPRRLLLRGHAVRPRPCPRCAGPVHGLRHRVVGTTRPRLCLRRSR
ncbi:alkaline phosphatase family protein [Streptomyces atratus]|uniref:alkaline phosphatase family protein n=1 Tax=Streptomyces atratus TaxID=1893 RepID=UPI002258E546|nr:alkaline phosphatase family protein [Streptomyces atratus]MCX5339688.1 alkaline phosphatase family protein [Streptomyces atratus]